ncbi:MAG: YlmH/Sll1252 family protein [Clostridium sp.]|nr:YlmH/Sll1252 family protein [Clostridium sp.]MCI7444086.1 YlmH/Sll1252 family protein [Clostridium sp.]
MNFEEDEKNDVLNLYEKYKLAYDKDITVFGNNFYTPNIWRFFQKNFNDAYFRVDSYGGFKDCERRMISFNNIYDSPYPIKLLKIESSSKFDNLCHRDYLGAVLGLGIRRNKIGDLLLKENACYLTVCEEITEFLADNLNLVGKAPCKVTILENNFEDLVPNFKQEIILVQSLRIDSIVSKLIGISRSKAQSIIEEGMVLLDYNKVKDKSKEVEIEGRITIKGHGKYILDEIIGNSKSGKFKVLVRKYM